MVATFVRWGYRAKQEVDSDLLFGFNAMKLSSYLFPEILKD
jgi:hypothetical protein